MTMLIVGVLLWAVVHLMPAVAPGFRQGLIDKLGSTPYRGLFALLVFGTLFVIVRGWQAAPEEYVFVPGPWSQPVGLILMILAFVLIGAAYYQTAIRRLIRHPMLSGVILWSISHILTGGTTRALVMFGGIGIWAVLEILLINRREGEYTRPVAPGIRGELVGVFISGIIFMIVLFLHPYFTGVTPYP
jgi:uncharacterized membrane protein